MGFRLGMMTVHYDIYDQFHFIMNMSGTIVDIVDLLLLALNIDFPPFNLTNQNAPHVGCKPTSALSVCTMCGVAHLTLVSGHDVHGSVTGRRFLGVHNFVDIVYIH